MEFAVGDVVKITNGNMLPVYGVVIEYEKNGLLGTGIRIIKRNGKPDFYCLDGFNLYKVEKIGWTPSVNVIFNVIDTNEKIDKRKEKNMENKVTEKTENFKFEIEWRDFEPGDCDCRCNATCENIGKGEILYKVGDVIEVKYRCTNDTIFGVIVSFGTNSYDKVYARVLTDEGKLSTFFTNSDPVDVTVLGNTSYISRAYDTIESYRKKQFREKTEAAKKSWEDLYEQLVKNKASKEDLKLMNDIYVNNFTFKNK